MMFHLTNCWYPCKTKAAGFFLNNGIRLKYMSSIVPLLKHLTLTDLKHNLRSILSIICEEVTIVCLPLLNPRNMGFLNLYFSIQEKWDF